MNPIQGYIIEGELYCCSRAFRPQRISGNADERCQMYLDIPMSFRCADIRCGSRSMKCHFDQQRVWFLVSTSDRSPLPEARSTTPWVVTVWLCFQGSKLSKAEHLYWPVQGLGVSSSITTPVTSLWVGCHGPCPPVARILTLVMGTNPFRCFRASWRARDKRRSRMGNVPGLSNGMIRHLMV